MAFCVGSEDASSPSLECGKVAAQQTVLYLQLLKVRGPCRRMRSGLSLLKLMQSQASLFRTRLPWCCERVL